MSELGFGTDISEIKEAMRIFILEDDDMFAELLEIAISRDGYSSKRVSNGRDGLAQVGHYSPHLIITDLMMPDMGGHEFLRELQTQLPGRVPIIVLTARSADSSLVEMIKAEANVVEFLHKPIRPRELLDMVQKALPLE